MCGGASRPIRGVWHIEQPRRAVLLGSLSAPNKSIAMRMINSDWLRRLPWSIVGCALALMLLGLTGISRGDELAHAGEFFSKQIVWIVLAVPAMFLATLVPYRVAKHHSYAWLGLSILLLALVYLFPAKWGSRRWIPLGVMNFQPSELAKLAFILALSRYLMYRENYRRLSGLAVPFSLTLVPMGLILKEPDLGTSLVFLPVLLAMLFAAGARLRHLVLIVCLGAAVSPIFWLAMSAEQKSRITALFQQRDGGPTPAGDGYHLHQSKQVLALGGVVGSQFAGTAVDDPMAYHLPACRTDFVFCMVGERWGLAGTLAVLALYLILFASGLIASARTHEPFGRLLAVGIVALIATQTIINVGMTVGLVPVTGITLPLLSYGGSSLLFTCVALGLLMNVAMRPGYEIGKEPFRFSS
jgi:cell division protein FtsW (lipid II flippase)